MLAKLQAVSSRNIYSEQGFEPLILPPSGQVCHSFIVVSNCTPGSAQAQAVYAILSHNSPASNTLHASGSRFSFAALSFSVLQTKFQFSPYSTASMNALGTLTELLLF